MEGERLGPYELHAKIGQGGMGAVYAATNTRTGGKVVLKLLLRHHTRDRELVARFLNEARAASQLDHENIVEVYDAGRLEDGTTYIVMEHLEGETLGDRLDREQKLGVKLASYICCGIACGLQAAHDAGIIHRDLKPDNIFLVADDAAPNGFRVKLLDFGIAKLMAPHAGAEQTATGVMLGTPSYMAPEQCRGLRSIDGRADLYALGCILYETLTGEPPFVTEGSGEVLAAHVDGKPPRLRSRDASLPKELDELGWTLLAKEPSERPARAMDVALILAKHAGVSTRSLPASQPRAPDAPKAVAAQRTSAAAAAAGPAAATREREGSQRRGDAPGRAAPRNTAERPGAAAANNLDDGQRADASARSRGGRHALRWHELWQRLANSRLFTKTSARWRWAVVGGLAFSVGMALGYWVAGPGAIHPPAVPRLPTTLP